MDKISILELRIWIQHPHWMLSALFLMIIFWVCITPGLLRCFMWKIQVCYIFLTCVKGNITPLTPFTTPTACYLGYTIMTFRGAQSGANPNKILNLAQFTNLAVGVWKIIGRLQYQIPDTGITFTQILTAFSMTALNSESQTVGSRGRTGAEEVVIQQHLCIPNKCNTSSHSPLP